MASYMTSKIIDIDGIPRDISLPPRGGWLNETYRNLNMCNISTVKFSRGNYLIKGAGWTDGDGGDGQNLGYSWGCASGYNPLTQKVVLHSIRCWAYNGKVTTHGCSDDGWGHEVVPKPPLLPDTGNDSVNTYKMSSDGRIIGNYTMARTNVYHATRVYADTGYVCYPWRMVWAGWCVQIRYKIVDINFPIPPCPPGTIFDSEYGWCVPLPDYEWDGGEYVPTTPGIPHIPPEPPGILPDPDNPDPNKPPLEPGDPIDCITVGGCKLPIMVELTPEVLSDIVPVGYNKKLNVITPPTTLVLDDSDAVIPKEVIILEDDDSDVVTGKCTTLTEECIYPDDEGPS